MSDIKYIIAGGDDDGGHTRFGCLAMVRYAVAAVVTVLTITVIALSIHAVLRSEDMGLSVNKGFISADTLWNGRLDKVTVPVKGAVKLSRRRGLRQAVPGAVLATTGTTMQVNFGSSSRPLPKDCLGGCRSGDQPSQVTFKKADRTNLRVILIADNPGGRTKIDCNGTHVSLFDMYPPYGKIGDVTLKYFTVPPQTTITLQQRLNNTDTSYIWENYRLASRFSVRVEVTSTVTSFPLGKKGKMVQQTYTCQPVTIGLIDDEDIYASDDHVHCTASSSG